MTLATQKYSMNKPLISGAYLTLKRLGFESVVTKCYIKIDLSFKGIFITNTFKVAKRQNSNGLQWRKERKAIMPLGDYIESSRPFNCIRDVAPSQFINAYIKKSILEKSLQ